MGKGPWRVGRKVGRTIYDADDRLIGVMDTPELAALAAAAPEMVRVLRSWLLVTDDAGDDMAIETAALLARIHGKETP